MRQYGLLLADNRSDYRHSLRILLDLEGYLVQEADSVEQALEQLHTSRPDLVLADLRLTTDENEYDISGLVVAQRAADMRVPCIIITAFPSVETTRQALRSRGVEPLAADYVPKANGPQAVLDAIIAVLGHPPAADLEIDLERRLVRYKGESLDLSQQQYDLLAYLYAQDERVCRPAELLEAVYGENVPDGQASADKRLERLAERLRIKIEEDPSNPRHLIKEPRRGYRLVM